jgi:hypothetical protein
MAAHYGTAILPARPRKPRDTAKVEQAVLIVERWRRASRSALIQFSKSELETSVRSDTAARPSAPPAAPMLVSPRMGALAEVFRHWLFVPCGCSRTASR